MMPSLAAAPAEQPPLPEAIRAAALRHGGDPHCVWVNKAGGSTWRLEDCFAKWNPAGSIESLGDEYQRMRWLHARFPCPEPVEIAVEEEGELLVTRALSGEGAVTETWMASPEVAVRAIAEGLRRLHALDASDCPFMVDVPASSQDDLVVCHGDACAPNTILASDGSFAGIVDLARIGIADRWFDLAISAMSLEWNYGDGYQPLLYETYGIEPNEERIRFWRSWWRDET